ncbi:MAG: dihydroorotate dehydrogenase [Bacteroidales bacterium]|nr:dihydroorotate dehydrogenase [Bacteroidales bacterium]MBQ2599423.1 dihydroorotate dehydrogenase [Bacteroidales bacterium]MBR4352042.1 dihydroorotate dehydrogenase [Bacteroidales bacterium]
MVNDTSVTLAGIRLQNPVIPASGTFGFGFEMAGCFDLNRLGAISLKGTTLEPRFGNPTPRIAECSGGLLNAVGLQNPGIDALVSDIAPRVRALCKTPLIANISGFSLDEYGICCEKADQCEALDIVEVNISCPNVHQGGMVFGTDPKAAAAVTRRARKATHKPLFIKLSPNVTDIVPIARACEEEGADGLTLINTLLGMRIDIRRRRPVLANRTGGFSGPALLPIALRFVNQVAKACRIPLIGCGGVASAEDVIEMMMAGATAVQVGSASLHDPLACPAIIDQLPKVMEQLGIEHLKDIIGIV